MTPKTAEVDVSVIIASRNSERFLDAAIASVMAQTHRDFELFIVDDGSTDSSLAIARDAAERDRRVRVIAMEENVGPARARNAALAESRGNWIAILDADDCFHETKLEKQLQLAEARGPGVVLVATNSQIVDEAGKATRTARYASRDRSLKRNLERMRAFPAHSSVLYRRSAAEKIGGYNPRFKLAEDADLFLRLGAQGTFALSPQTLVSYRWHGGSVSRRRAQELLRYAIAARTCHFVRGSGGVDPSTGETEETWRYFLEWLDEYLAREGIDSKLQELNAASASLFRGGAGIDRIKAAAGYAARRPRIALAMARRKLLGVRITKTIAEKWIEKTATSRATR